MHIYTYIWFCGQNDQRYFLNIPKLRKLWSQVDSKAGRKLDLYMEDLCWTSTPRIVPWACKKWSLCTTGEEQTLRIPRCDPKPKKNFPTKCVLCIVWNSTLLYQKKITAYSAHKYIKVSTSYFSRYKNQC